MLPIFLPIVDTKDYFLYFAPLNLSGFGFDFSLSLESEEELLVQLDVYSNFASLFDVYLFLAELN